MAPGGVLLGQRLGAGGDAGGGDIADQQQALARRTYGDGFVREDHGQVLLQRLGVVAHADVDHLLQLSAGAVDQEVGRSQFHALDIEAVGRWSR